MNPEKCINYEQDSIVEEVRQDLKKRSELGIKKYGTTLDRDDISLIDWHQHQYEELLDAAVYTKKIIKQLEADMELRYQKIVEKIESNTQ